MSKLIRASELELAAAVGQVLGTTQTSLRMAVELLARRCERIGCWSVCLFVCFCYVYLCVSCCCCCQCIQSITHSLPHLFTSSLLH